MSKSISLFLILFGLLSSGACVCSVGGEKIAACQMVTKTDAEKIAGTPTRVHSENDDAQENGCLYGGENGDSNVYLQATLQTFPDAESLKNAEEMSKTIKAQYGKIETVAGVGVAACLETASDSQTLHVRRGNVAFFISATGGAGGATALREMRRGAEVIALKL